MENLITSRSSRDFLARACDGCHECTIEDVDVSEGVQKLVKDVLAGNESINALLEDHPDLRKEIIQLVTSRARGM